MSEKQMFEILKSLLSQAEIEKLSESLIITIPGGYELFGEYTINKVKIGYSVRKYRTALDEHFYSLQNATIYAILHKRNKIVEAKRMLELDILYENANAELERHRKHGLTFQDSDARYIAFSKYEEARHKRKIYGSEIQNYLQETKVWQETRFREAVK